MKKAKRTCVIVAGMHRSGTSALARVLSLLGCELPLTVMGSGPANETGFWEPQDVMVLNDELLESAGSSWDDCTPCTPGWFVSPRAEEFRERCAATYEAEYGDAKLTILKEPRICRLLPFWLSVIEGQGIEPLVILPIRNPLAVAASLAKRDLSDPFYNQHLWLRHVLDAEQGSRGKRRFFCGYDNLLESWSAVISKSEVTLDVKWPRFSAKASEEIDSYISTRYRHHVASIDEVLADTSISIWLRQTYEIMLRWVAKGEDKADYASLDKIGLAFDASCTSFARVLYRGKQAQSELLTLKDKKNQQDDIIGELTQRSTNLNAVLADAEQVATHQNQERDIQSQQLAGLQSQLDSITENRDQLLTTLTSLQLEMTTAQSELTNLQASLDSAQYHSHHVNVKNAELEAALGNKTRDHVEVKADLQSMQDAQRRIEAVSAAELEARTQENDVLQAALQAEREKYNFLESQFATKEASYAAMHVDLTRLRKQVDELTTSLIDADSCRAKQDQHLASESEMWTDKLATLTRELEAGTAIIDSQKSYIDGLTATVQAERDQKTATQDEVNRLAAFLETAQLDLNHEANTAASLLADLSIARAQSIADTASVEGLKAHINLLTEDLQAAQSQSVEVQDAHTAHVAQLDAMLAARTELQGEVTHLSANLTQSEQQSAASNAVIDGLKAHINLLTQDLQAAQSQSLEAQDAHNAVITQLHFALAAHTELHVEVNQLSASLSQSNQQAVTSKAEIDGLNARIDLLAEGLQAAQSQSVEAQEVHNVLIGELASVLDARNELQAQVTQLRATLSRNEQQAAIHGDLVDGLKSQIDLLLGDVDAAKVADEQNEALIAAQRSEIAAIKASTQVTEGEMALRLDEKMQELQRQLQAIAALQTSLDQQSDEKRQMEGEKQALSQAIDAATQQVADTQAQLSELRSADARNQLIINGLKQHVHLLISDVDTAKADLETERTNQTGLWRIIDQVQADLAAAEQREADAHNKVADLESAMSQTQSALRQRSAEASDLHKDLEQAKAAVLEERQRREALSNEKASLDGRVTALRAALELREKDVAQTQTTIDSLQAKIVRQSNEHQTALRAKENVTTAMLQATQLSSKKLRDQVNALVRGLAEEKHAFFSRKSDATKRKAALLVASGIIDVDYYRAINHDVAVSGMDPAIHYLTAGIGEGRSGVAD